MSKASLLQLNSPVNVLEGPISHARCFAMRDPDSRSWFFKGSNDHQILGKEHMRMRGLEGAASLILGYSKDSPDLHILASLATLLFAASRV
jgi:hypothetical protein